MTEDRCGLCGKPMKPGEDIAVITRATITKTGSHKPRKPWGTVHESCLNNALPTPKAALNEINRLAKHAVRQAEIAAKAKPKKPRRRYGVSATA